MALNDYFAGLEERHQAAADRGEHDDQCEWGVRHRNGRTIRNYICNCSKRRREREGYTTPPGPLEYRAPDCPRCAREVIHDEDGFTCPPCRAAWTNGMDEPAEFVDDYGDLT